MCYVDITHFYLKATLCSSLCGDYTEHTTHRWSGGTDFAVSSIHFYFEPFLEYNIFALSRLHISIYFPYRLQKISLTILNLYTISTTQNITWVKKKQWNFMTISIVQFSEAKIAWWYFGVNIVFLWSTRESRESMHVLVTLPVQPPNGQGGQPCILF